MLYKILSVFALLAPLFHPAIYQYIDQSDIHHAVSKTLVLKLLTVFHTVMPEKYDILSVSALTALEYHPQKYQYIISQLQEAH